MSIPNTPTMIVCLLLDPFPLWHAQRHHPDTPVAITERGRIRHASQDALRAGVSIGMTVHAATSRAPDLHTEELSPPLLHATWDALVEGMFAYSPNIEPLAQGRVLLTAHEGPARELAALLHARVGLAHHRETALLAAFTAAPGEVRVVRSAETSVFLRALPLDTLSVTGMNPRHLQRLRVLGLRTTGDLMQWSQAQQTAFLGADANVIRPYLQGPRTSKVQSYRPAPALEAGFDFDEAALEPCQLEPALHLLATRLHEQLGARHARRIVVRARTPLGWLEAAREVKEPLRDARAVERLAHLALSDTNAAPLGIERLEVIVTGLARPGRQVGLWPGVRELDAVDALLRRFPNALVRCQPKNEFAYASDARYAWVDFRSGETRARRAPGAATPTPPRTPGPTVTPARNRARAFFECPGSDGGSAS